ncbi:MAG: radical SAM protein [Deltaproteobacteria bacterium]|nr:radical SAM protein [Deltaproteobacteria bacterium]
MRIREIYRSIQGESTFAGLPCTFIRTAGCPLRCVWCDTEYAFAGGEELSHEQIISRVAQLGAVHHLELTGGEPLAQPDAPALLTRLADRGYRVLLETSGAFAIEAIDRRVRIILDIKCPDSGESGRNRWENIAQLAEKDQVKFVLASRSDYEYARQVIETHRLAERCGELLLSTVFDRLEPRQVVAWLLEDQLPVRFQLQLHKFVWPPNTPGV